MAARIPTAQDSVAYVTELSDRDLCGIFCGSMVLLRDPVSHKNVVRSAFQVTDSERLQKVELGKYLGELVMRERAALIPQIAESIRFAAQMAPELVVAAMNEVRRNFNMPTYVDPALEGGPFEGIVRAQNATQTVLLDKLGKKSIVLENSTLSTVPPHGASVKVERAKGPDSFTVTVLQLGSKRDR